MMTTDTPEHTRRRLKEAAGWTAVAVTAGVAGIWGGGIHMDLMNLAMRVFALFGPEVLPFRFEPVPAAIRLGCAAGAVYMGWRMVRMRRAEQGRCARCGVGDRPRRDRRRLARRAAYLSILPASCYSLLKVHWALGGTVGIADPSVMGEVDLFSPGFLDTAIMAVVGIGVALGMTHRWRLPRVVLLVPALIGLAMLVPVSVVGNLGNVVSLFITGDHVLGLAAWTTWFVYACFTVWAVCLLIVTGEYAIATAGACRSCGRRRHGEHDRIAG